MNEFTKEELEELNSMIHRYMYACIDVTRTNILHKKIQSMIDNYCDHPESYMFRYEGWINYCDKCKRMWKTKKDIE